MLVGSCIPCGRFYRVETPDLSRSICPECQRPLRLTTDQEAVQRDKPIEPLAPPDPPPTT
jgi:hypothetical protein